MATTIIDEAERARRAEFMRESRAACLHGISSEQRTQQREAKADGWTEWFQQKMDSVGCSDPVALLPDAFARLEQLNEDRIVAALRDLKATLRKVLE